MKRLIFALLCLLPLFLSTTVNSFAVETSRLYFPHVASDANWETEIGIINTGDTLITGQLHAYSNSGIEIENMELNLATGARSELKVGNDFINPGQISYIAYEYDSKGSCSGYEKFYMDDQRVAVPAVSRLNGETINLSHIASNINWWTGFAFVTTTSEDKIITFTLNDGSMYSLSLDAGEHWAGTLAGNFPEVDAPNIESATITNTTGIIGLELFGSTSNSGNHYLAAYCSPTKELTLFTTLT
jgi:hypothetical protein